MNAGRNDGCRRGLVSTADDRDVRVEDEASEGPRLTVFSLTVLLEGEVGVPLGESQPVAKHDRVYKHSPDALGGLNFRHVSCYLLSSSDSTST